MIRLPFGRALKDKNGDKPSETFATYCRDELERRRDCGADFDEERFKAAVDLAVEKLVAMEEKEGKA